MTKQEFDTEVGRILGIKSVEIVATEVRFSLDRQIRVTLVVKPTQKKQDKLVEFFIQATTRLKTAKEK